MRQLWNRESGEVFGEPGLFIERGKIQMLFPAETVLRVFCSALGTEYLPGKDWIHQPGSEVLIRPEGSAIPLLTDSMLHPEGNDCFYYPDPNANAVPGGVTGRNIRFDAKNFFARMQIEIDYKAKKIDFKPPNKPLHGRLPRFSRLLRTREAACRITWLGDSISEGYNASGFLKLPPYQPPFAELVAEALRDFFSVNLDFRNHARNGAATGYPLSDPSIFLPDKPDLLVIAFGMNDLAVAGGLKTYLDNIREIIRLNREVSPETEYLLVSPMSGNPEWRNTPVEMTKSFAEALRGLAENSGPEIGFADIFPVWSSLLQRKNFFDLTGNGVNHPNDYGHKVLVGCVLSALAPEISCF